MGKKGKIGKIFEIENEGKGSVRKKNKKEEKWIREKEKKN